MAAFFCFKAGVFLRFYAVGKRLKRDWFLLMERLRLLLWLCGKSFVLATGCNLKIFYFEVEFGESCFCAGFCGC